MEEREEFQEDLMLDLQMLKLVLIIALLNITGEKMIEEFIQNGLFAFLSICLISIAVGFGFFPKKPFSAIFVSIILLSALSMVFISVFYGH
jgi:hypothetical protein